MDRGFTVDTANDAQSKLRDADGLRKRRGIWHYKLKVAGH